MQFWLDAQLPPKIANWMQETFELDVKAIDSIGLRGATDATIWSRLSAEGNVLFTKDVDFVELITRLGPPPQVVWLTCGNVTNRALQALLSRTLPDVIVLLENGEPLVELGDDR